MIKSIIFFSALALSFVSQANASMYASGEINPNTGKRFLRLADPNTNGLVELQMPYNMSEEDFGQLMELLQKANISSVRLTRVGLCSGVEVKAAQ